MEHNKWSCPKCNEKSYEIGEIRVAGGFWSKIFNVQSKRYSSVSCEKCSFTEFYKSQSSSTMANIFDLFTN